MPLLDYYKVILDKVSFYPELFAKEYKKAQRQLAASDALDLNRWVSQKGFEVLLEGRALRNVSALADEVNPMI